MTSSRTSSVTGRSPCGRRTGAPRRRTAPPPARAPRRRAARPSAGRPRTASTADRRRDPERGHAGRRRREGEVVPRPRPRAARRPRCAAVAAHLERGGDVDGPVERPRGHRSCDRGARGRATRAAALGVVHPPGVAREHRDHPRRQRGGQRRAEREAPEQPQQLVRVDRRRVQREAGDHDERAQAEDAAVDGRLERHVDLAQRRELAEARDHGQPLAHHERVDERDQHGERRPPHSSERATTPPTRAPAPATSTAASTAPSSSGCSNDSATAASTMQNSEPTPARAACSGLERRPVDHGVIAPPAGNGSGTSRPFSSATAKRSFSRSSTSAAAAAATPTRSVPRHHPRRVLVEVPRRRHEPRARAQRPHALAARVEQLELLALPHRPREHARHLRPLLEPPRGRIDPDLRPRADQQAQHARPGAGPERPEAADPRARLLEPLAHLAALAQGVLRAVDPHRDPRALRAGLEGLRERADDGRDSHRAAPVVMVPPHAVARLELARGRAAVGLDPVDVVEPVDRAAAAPPAADAVDLLHEAAAEARLHVEVTLQLAHDGLPARDRLGLLVPQLLGAEVARDRELRAADRRVAGADAAARERGAQDEEREQAPHRTSTARGHDRTIPARSAVSRAAPLAGAATVATPLASVVATAAPSRTVAPATGTPRPLSS